jgi:hypothetical protein
VQDSYHLPGDRGLSDFDAHRRFLINAIYELSFKSNQLVAEWQHAALAQAQSGNPANIVISNSTVNEVANTLRPDVVGPIKIPGSVDAGSTPRYYARHGGLDRNVLMGPGFRNTDFSVIKNLQLGEKMRVQVRAAFFDLFNHANFGQPRNVVGTTGLRPHHQHTLRYR